MQIKTKRKAHQEFQKGISCESNCISHQIRAEARVAKVWAPLIVIALAVAVTVTITQNRNGYEGARTDR
jgi:hypothetical protein